MRGLSVLVLVTIFLSACGNKENEAKRSNEFEQERARLEAIEKEANLSGLDWYEVKISKYDGDCVSLGTTPRREVEGYHASTWLKNARVNQGNYFLTYDLGGPYYVKMYTTSVDWCENTIKANVK